MYQVLQRVSVSLLFSVVVQCALTVNSGAMEIGSKVKLSELIELDRVSSVKVICYPEENTVRAALTPDMLLSLYQRKIQIYNGESKIWISLVKALDHTTLTIGGNSGDLRWALIFKDARGDTIKHLSIDRRKKVAILDSKIYHINGELLKWLTEIKNELESIGVR